MLVSSAAIVRGVALAQLGFSPRDLAWLILGRSTTDANLDIWVQQHEADLQIAFERHCDASNDQQNGGPAE